MEETELQRNGIIMMEIKKQNQMVKWELYILFPSEELIEREPKTGAPTSCFHNFLKGRFYITHKISYEEKPSALHLRWVCDSSPQDKAKEKMNK